VAEYSSAAAVSNGTQYLTADNLGTPRVVTLADGRVKARHDYLPFGEEVFAGTSGRTATQGYVSDNTRQKFTGYERDGETGLDYAQARYYASAQGRFTSPDPLLSSGRTENPQTWNRFTYTLNNPLKYTDPLGLFEWFNDDDNVSKEERKRREKFLKAYGNLKQLRDQIGKKLGTDSDEYVRLNKVITTIGEEGDGNDVKIEFGPIFGQGGAGSADGPILDLTGRQSKDGGKAYLKLTLDFNEIGSSNRLVEAIGHEGQHIVDLKAGLRKGGENNYKLEFRAFEVSSFIQEGQGESRGYDGGGGRVWREEWKHVDRATLRTHRKDAINHLLSNNKHYEYARPPREER